MSRAAGLCGKCGGPRRGRAAGQSDAVADCDLCHTALCVRHSRYDPDGDRTVCVGCGRKNGLRLLKTVA